MKTDHDRHRRDRLETFLTRVPPGLWGKASTSEFPIEEGEWLEFVAHEPELVSVAGKDLHWKLESHPSGEELFFERGAVAIAKDDPETIEFMVACAPRLQAFVISESGEVFEAIQGEVHGSLASAFQDTVEESLRVPTEEEHMRRRQLGALAVIGCVFPSIVAYWTWIGEAAPIHYLIAIASLAVVAWAISRIAVPIYVLERQGGQIAVWRRSTRSSRDEISVVRLDPGALSALQLVWFPLEYPSYTTLEFHVRGKSLPWLVLYSSRNEETARKKMKELARTLLLAESDQTHGPPAQDIPRPYLLTADEKKKASASSKWIFAASFAAFALAFLAAGYRVTAGLFAIPSLTILVSSFWTKAPRILPEKYSRWLKKKD